MYVYGMNIRLMKYEILKDGRGNEIMKYFPKIFIMGTVGSIGISIFLLMLGFESTVAIVTLKALIIHALVSVPIIINQKFIGEDKRKFIKTMVIVSTIFLLFGLIFMHIVFPKVGARGGIRSIS